MALTLGQSVTGGPGTIPNPLFMPGLFSAQSGQPEQKFIADPSYTPPISIEQQKLNLFAKLLGGMFGQGGGIEGFGGLGGGGNADGSFLNLFDLARERAQQGLQDQFTMAGGASSLTGPFEAASANLQRGLGQTEQGNIVDLFSRIYGPNVALLTSLLK